MPGKGSKARREAKKLKRIAELRQKEIEYLNNGGKKICRACYNSMRCPVDSETENMPCWAYREN